MRYSDADLAHAALTVRSLTILLPFCHFQLCLLWSVVGMAKCTVYQLHGECALLIYIYQHDILSSH